ncbi:MAG: hypothetical protein J0M12_07550 [Deltaproteobacteria bacterium]|nr:hypothetical protein [Deltaproteobacteria bacterium]
MGKLDKNRKPMRVGGMAFFSSLFFLSVLAILNFCLLTKLWSSEAFVHLQSFALGVVPGLFVAAYFIQGRGSVLIHEFKHSLVSGLVGNRARSMNVKKDSGHFEYEYTKHTAQYNAFISMAPYITPLFTIPAAALAFAFWRQSHDLMCVVVGMGYGIDLLLNMRDISRRQTDITMIRGGYLVGVLYIAAMNAAILSILLAWVFEDTIGLQYLLYGLWHLVLQIVAYYRAAPAALSSL